MTVKYKTLITTAGAAKFAAATAGGTKITITQMAVGDGGGTLPVPDVAQTKLIREKWRAALNKISVDAKKKNYVIAELVIPPEVGGFWLREMGLYDADGTLVAVANMAESYKPELAEGSGRAQTLRMVIIVSAVESVELVIDTTMVMATQDYVDDKIAEHEQSRRHPDASLTAKGLTQLSSATDSISEVLAATPKAVKAAYDLANGKYTALDATTARKGLVQLSSATDSTSEVLAATPKAVKAAYDLANGKYSAQDATTTRKGIVQLSSATDSTSEVLAATPKAVKAANDNANGRVPSGRKINGRALSADISLGAADVGALPAGGGRLTGNIEIFSAAPIIQLTESDTGKKFFIVADGNGFRINEDSTSGSAILTYAGGSKVLSSVGQIIPGNYTNFDAKYQPKGSYTPANEAYTKAASDTRFQPKGNYTPAGEAYTKAQSDASYAVKTNVYTKTEGDGRYALADSLSYAGFVSNDATNPYFRHKSSNTVINLATRSYTYSKAESDGRFQPKGSYTPAGEAHTKAVSDGRYLSTLQRGSQSLQNGTHGNLVVWEAPTGCFMTGVHIRSDLGDCRFMGYYYRALMMKTVSGGWVQIGN